MSGKIYFPLRLENAIRRPVKIRIMKTLTEINSVCTSVEDLGVVETDYGSKPQVKFTFETRPENDDGHGRKLCRTFNKFFHEKSALCIAIKSWTGRDLAEEFEKIGEPDLREFVGDEATLKIEPRIGRRGTAYENIAEVLPAEKAVAACEGAEENE